MTYYDTKDFFDSKMFQVNYIQNNQNKNESITINRKDIMFSF